MTASGLVRLSRRKRPAALLPRSLPCGICGTAVMLSRERFLLLVKSDRKPLCRINGCCRYNGFSICALNASGEVVFDDAWTARVPEGREGIDVESLVYQAGTGKRGHQAAPLANGRVKRRVV